MNKRRHQVRKGRLASEAFERGLEAFENHERPAGYPGLNAENRKAASRAQFETFVQKYWPDWRHMKIRLYRRILEERSEILAIERQRLEVGGLDPKTVVFQELTNGILASAVSEFCQYAEDLALLSQACASEQYFARDLASTSAGRLQRRVREWRGITEKGAAELLRIPFLENRADWQDSDLGRQYLAALARTAERVRAIGSLYTLWEFHFMRYKHGLLLALRYAPGQDEEYCLRRSASLKGFPVAFDCGSVSEAIDQDHQKGLIIPDVGDRSGHVKWNAAKLASERNLLREVYPPGVSEVDIREFELAASWLSQLQRVLIFNRAEEIAPQPGRPYHMPAEAPGTLLTIYLEAKPG